MGRFLRKLALVAIANALDGMSRMAVARSAGMDRQTLRDWVIRYNADGIAKLHDQLKEHMPEKRTESEQAAMLAVKHRPAPSSRLRSTARR